MDNELLLEALQEARITVDDTDREVVLAWFGGHGIHAYDLAGNEVGFWNTGDFANHDASEEEVLESIESHKRDGYYPY